MVTLLLITGLYAGKLEYFIGPLNLVYPFIYPFCFVQQTKRIKKLKTEASPRPNREYGNKNSRGAMRGVRTLFGKIQSLIKEPILNESLSDLRVPYYKYGAHVYPFPPLSILYGYARAICRTVITDEGYTSHPLRGRSAPRITRVGAPEMGKLNMENEQSAGNLGHSDSLAALEPLELSKLIATYPARSGGSFCPIGGNPTCINSYISDHMSKHVRPETDEEFGYYLAGLIEGDG